MLFGMNKVEYERDFSYCFNCGRRVSQEAASDKDDYCSHGDIKSIDIIFSSLGVNRIPILISH
jgi:DNA-directed RNA polymerase subunit N (RpoN/RPB10)